MSRTITTALSLTLALAAACTTLGPSPATTGMSAVPAARPSVEGQIGFVPGHYLSSAVVEKPEGAGIGQVGLSIEPDTVIEVPGLVVGARLYGQDGDTPIEPVIGYRRSSADGRFAYGAFAFGTMASASREGASYEASRFGVELAGDVRGFGSSRWAEVHAFGGLSATRVSVDGDYCVDAMGRYGVQCPEDGAGTMRSGHADGIYPAGHLGLSTELFRHRPGLFHGARLAATAAIGTMPRVVDGQQTGAEAYFSIGLMGSIAIGSE